MKHTFVNPALCQHKIISRLGKAVHPSPPDLNKYDQTAVMALFLLNQALPKLLFIQKADVAGYPWRNQMAFPGGHVDDTDDSPLETALRSWKKNWGSFRKMWKSSAPWAISRQSTTKISTPLPVSGTSRTPSDLIPWKSDGFFRFRCPTWPTCTGKKVSWTNPTDPGSDLSVPGCGHMGRDGKNPSPHAGHINGSLRSSKITHVYSAATAGTRS